MRGRKRPENAPGPDDRFGGLGLTRREAVVLGKLAEGLSYAEIAASLAISYHTVHTHIKSLHQKAGVRSNARLLALWNGHREKP